VTLNFVAKRKFLLSQLLMLAGLISGTDPGSNPSRGRNWVKRIRQWINILGSELSLSV